MGYTVELSAARPAEVIGALAAAGVDVAATAPVAWDLLVELDMWPRWGPSVRAARLGDGPSGAGRLHGGASGAVQTPARLWLPFTVTDWHEAADGSGAWGWRVAGAGSRWPSRGGHRVT